MPFFPQVVGVGKTSCPAAPAQAVIADQEERVIGFLKRHIGWWLDLILHTQQDIQQLRRRRGFIRDADAGTMEFYHGFRGVEEDIARGPHRGDTKTRHRIETLCKAKTVYDRN